MKKLTIEQKAKAYDEALSVALETYQTQPMYREWLKKMFPELPESEDEKIRKELIDAIRGLWDNDALPMPLSAKRKNEWIAWLENIPVTIDHEKREGFHLGYKACHEKQGEQNDSDVKDYNSIDPHFGKPIDKIEPTYYNGCKDVLNKIQKGE